MDLNNALLTAVSDAPRTTIDIDKVIAGERRRIRTRRALGVLAGALVLAAGVIAVPAALSGQHGTVPGKGTKTSAAPPGGAWWGNGDPPAWALTPPCRPPDGGSYRVTGDKWTGINLAPQPLAEIPADLTPIESCPMATRRLAVAVDKLVRQEWPEASYPDALGADVVVTPDGRYGYQAMMIVDFAGWSGELSVTLAPRVDLVPERACAELGTLVGLDPADPTVTCTRSTAADGAVVVSLRDYVPGAGQAIWVRVFRVDRTVVDVSSANMSLVDPGTPVLTPDEFAAIGQGAQLTLYP